MFEIFYVINEGMDTVFSPFHVRLSDMIYIDFCFILLCRFYIYMDIISLLLHCCEAMYEQLRLFSYFFLSLFYYLSTSAFTSSQNYINSFASSLALNILFSQNHKSKIFLTFSFPPITKNTSSYCLPTCSSSLNYVSDYSQFTVHIEFEFLPWQYNM